MTSTLPKDLLTIVTRPDQEAAFAAAEALSARWDAHVAILQLSEMPTPMDGAGTFTVDLWAEILTAARKAAAEDREAIAKRANGFVKQPEIRSVEVTLGGAEGAAAFQAMHSDLAIFERSDDPMLSAAFEGALFRSGRPTLVVPPGWRAASPLGRNVLVAWSAKREAARALADAAPFFADAEKVSVVTIDARPGFESSAPPGIDISAHLARRGLNVSLRQTDSMGRDVEDALIEEARAVGADLLVMGGFGHARLREFVFGGATRGMLKKSPIPLFMSH